MASGIKAFVIGTKDATTRERAHDLPPDKGEVASAIRERFVVANEDGKPGRAHARRRAVSLGVSALDQLLDIRGQDPSEAHVPVPIFDLSQW